MGFLWITIGFLWITCFSRKEEEESDPPHLGPERAARKRSAEIIQAFTF